MSAPITCLYSPDNGPPYLSDVLVTYDNASGNIMLRFPADNAAAIIELSGVNAVRLARALVSRTLDAHATLAGTINAIPAQVKGAA